MDKSHKPNLYLPSQEELNKREIIKIYENISLSQKEEELKHKFKYIQEEMSLSNRQIKEFHKKFLDLNNSISKKLRDDIESSSYLAEMIFNDEKYYIDSSSESKSYNVSKTYLSDIEDKKKLQEIFDNTFNYMLEKLEINEDESDKIFDEIININNSHDNLFTNNRKYNNLIRDNHYFSFLKNCEIKNDIFFTYAESLIRGYKVLIEIKEMENNNINIKRLKEDMNVLEKYNDKGNNNSSIKNIREKIFKLELSKTARKYLPAVLVAIKLELSISTLSNYIKKTLKISSIEKTDMKNKKDEIQSNLKFL